ILDRTRVDFQVKGLAQGEPGTGIHGQGPALNVQAAFDSAVTGGNIEGFQQIVVGVVNPDFALAGKDVLGEDQVDVAVLVQAAVDEVVAHQFRLAVDGQEVQRGGVVDAGPALAIFVFHDIGFGEQVIGSFLLQVGKGIDDDVVVVDRQAAALVTCPAIHGELLHQGAVGQVQGHEPAGSDNLLVKVEMDVV